MPLTISSSIYSYILFFIRVMKKIENKNKNNSDKE